MKVYVRLSNLFDLSLICFSLSHKSSENVMSSFEIENMLDIPISSEHHAKLDEDISSNTLWFADEKDKQHHDLLVQEAEVPPLPKYFYFFDINLV